MALVTKKLLGHLAHLSRLELSEYELKKFANDLDAILKYVKELKAVDSAEIEPMTGAANLKNIFRDDTIDFDRRALSASDGEKIIGAFPESDKGFLKVPKVL